MAPLRLGIDLDGVVTAFNEGWIDRYNDEFGTAIEPGDATSWHAPVDLTHFRSMSRFWRWAQDCAGGASLFRHLDPYPGALDALHRLARHHDVVVLTTKPSYAVHDTLAWLAEHRFPSTEIHILEDKSAVGCDVYLDDGDHNIARYLDHQPEAIVCRYVRPWNSPHRGAVDVENWDQFEQVVAKVAEELAG